MSAGSPNSRLGRSSSESLTEIGSPVAGDPALTRAGPSRGNEAGGSETRKIETRAGLAEGRARWRSSMVEVGAPPQETRVGVMPQISSGYWRIVRSLENLP